MKFNIEQRVFLIETYAKKSSCSVCRYKFIQKFPGVNVPSKSTIEKLVKKFRSTGSVLNKKTKRRRSVLTEEKLDEIGAVLEKYPTKSLIYLAELCSVSCGSVRTATRLLQLPSYKQATSYAEVSDMEEPKIKVERDDGEETLEQNDVVVHGSVNDVGVPNVKVEPIDVAEAEVQNEEKPDLTRIKLDITIDDHSIDLKDDQGNDLNLFQKDDSADIGIDSFANLSEPTGPVLSMEIAECNLVTLGTSAVNNEITTICFRNKKLFSMRQSGENMYKCDHCGKCFAQRSDFGRHIRIHSGEKKYKCDHCGKCFAQRSDFGRHIRIHSGEKKYKCEQCGKCFTDCSSLKRHYRIHSGEKNYKCVECGNCFAQVSSLKRHLKIHSCIKDYKCENCGKCFSGRDHLKTHLKIHSDEKEYKCQECDKCFSRLEHLKSHQRVHFGSKDFKCEVCGRCFVRLENLKSHTKVHSGVKDFICESCGRRFSLGSALKRHLKSHAYGKGYLCK